MRGLAAANEPTHIFQFVNLEIPLIFSTSRLFNAEDSSYITEALKMA